MKQALQWQDYEPEQAALVNAWLDREAIRYTGLDDGFDAFYQYWKRNSDPVRGENFYCKIVSKERRPVAVVAFSYHQQTVVVMEIVVDPILRGQGRGTAIINELVDHAAHWIGQPMAVFEAVIFPHNTVSQTVFYKTGFVPVSDEKDNDRWRRTADTTEILFRYAAKMPPTAPDWPVRRLRPDERALFNRHLRLCQQKPMTGKRWRQIIQADIGYYGLFAEGKMVARACVEKLTDRYWEISDVRVANAFRNRGCATAIVAFLTDEILSRGKIPTIRTEKDNAAMRNVIQKLRFRPFSEDNDDEAI